MARPLPALVAGATRVSDLRRLLQAGILDGEAVESPES
jgi:hypothetical protein